MIDFSAFAGYKEIPQFLDLHMTRREDLPSEQETPINPEEMRSFIHVVWNDILDHLKARVRQLLFPVDPISEKLLATIQGQVCRELDRLIRVETDTDTRSIKNALSALDYMSLPSVVRNIFASALNHPALANDAAIKIIPATGVWEWMDSEAAPAFQVKNLFREPLKTIPIQKLRVLQGKIWSLVVDARKQGAEAEVIHLMGFLADQIEHSISKKMESYDRYDSRSKEAHAQLMTISERGEVERDHIYAPDMAGISMITEMATEEENEQLQSALRQGFDKHWEQRLKLDRDELWNSSLPRPLNMAEMQADEALRTVMPGQMAPVDLLVDERYYGWALARSGEDDRQSLLEVIVLGNLQPLLAINSPILGSFQGISPDIQFATIPEQTATGELLSEKDQETAFVNRILLGTMPFRKHQSYIESFEGEEGGWEKGIEEHELWWMYGQLRNAFSQADTLGEVLEKILPGIDEHFLLKMGKNDTQKNLFRKRFELWGKASEGYFNRKGQENIGLMMDTFFYSLANEDVEKWKELNLFRLLKNSFELEVEDGGSLEKASSHITRSMELLTRVSIGQIKNNPELLNEPNPYLNAWMKNEAKIRLSLLEDIVKRRLRMWNGQVVMDAIPTLPFSPTPESFGFPVIRHNAIFWIYFPEPVESTL